MSSSLSRYQKKRHFAVSPEPRGTVLRSNGSSYVIQKHDASHLHYDFRLELDGVLKSWAVPKGPSLDPSVKRLAVEVEDHPVDYGGFEGTIPKGQYGGGTVMLWDRGTWSPLDDPHQGLKAGKLKFVLNGEKLQGAWMLVRSRSRAGSGKPQWLLFKEKDEFAVPAKKGDVLEQFPVSVATGRDLDEIAVGKTVNGKTSHQNKRSLGPKSKTSVPEERLKDQYSTPATIRGAVSASMPKKIDVQLATLIDHPPTGEEWFHEVKFDGYRMICRKDRDKVQFISRNHQDWTSRLTSLADVVKKLPVERAILDGEVVTLESDGTTSFQKLQNAFRDSRSSELSYFVFDLLYLNGKSFLEVPLEQRKVELEKLVAALAPDSSIRYSEHICGSGEEFQHEACRLKLEGMISKRRDRPYHSGRGTDWLKIKCVKTEEFVIGGYTDPSGERSGFGALLVGYHDSKGQLKYAGKVGTGFSTRDLTSLTKQLKTLERPNSPFIDRRQRTGPTRTAHWVEPSLVGQFKYASRTDENLLRHASFQGLREDKPAEEVSLEVARPLKSSKSSAGGRKRSTASSNGCKPASVKSVRPNEKKDEFAGVRFTNPDKVLYPERSITKLMLAEYYEQVADWILPHLAHRPIVLVRCPDGATRQCFYQKHPGVGTPDILRQISISEKHGPVNYGIVDNVKALIATVQSGGLEIHAWGSREDKLEYPDQLIFDLDPSPEILWPTLVESARQIRHFLQELGLESYVKTTGGKGLHLVVPIDRRHDWDQAKAFCKQTAEVIVAADPNHYTANLSKAARTGKIFIDYLRNGRGATAVVPYSTRRTPDATVATPLSWEELTARVTSSGMFTVENISKRLASLKKDPWKDFGTTRQSLSGPLKKLKSLMHTA